MREFLQKALTRKCGCISYKSNERLVRAVERAACFETEAAWSCGEPGIFTHHHNCNTKWDRFQDLQPSVHIHKWFGKEITFKYHANRHSTNQALSVMEESKAFIGPAKYTRAQTEIVNVICANLVRGVGFKHEHY